jgi:hypothetical protein
MKLDSRKPAVSLSLPLHPLNGLNWSSKPDRSTAEQEFEASTWVQLRSLPSPYSHDEALLLCQQSESEWMVWIPNYGEMILHRSQFDQAC